MFFSFLGISAIALGLVQLGTFDVTVQIFMTTLEAAFAVGLLYCLRPAFSVSQWLSRLGIDASEYFMIAPMLLT